MAQDNWLATGLGTFTASGDWSLGTVPTALDDAFIGTSGAIVGSGFNQTVNSISTGTNSDVLLINGASVFTTENGGTNSGTITVDDGSSFVVGAGTLFNPGTVPRLQSPDAVKVPKPVASQLSCAMVLSSFH